MTTKQKISIVVILVLLAIGSIVVVGIVGNNRNEARQAKAQAQAKANAEAEAEAEAKAKADAEQAKADAEAKAKAAEATKRADAIHKSNLTSWQKGDSDLRNEAQIALIPETERTIRELIEEGFNQPDPIEAGIAGYKIYSIGGESCIPLVLSYKDDPRTAVANNVRNWYKKYSPGAIIDKIADNHKVSHGGCQTASVNGSNPTTTTVFVQPAPKPTLVKPAKKAISQQEKETRKDIELLKSKIQTYERNLSACREEARNAWMPAVLAQAQKDAQYNIEQIKRLKQELQEKEGELE